MTEIPCKYCKKPIPKSAAEREDGQCDVCSELLRGPTATELASVFDRTQIKTYYDSRGVKLVPRKWFCNSFASIVAAPRWLSEVINSDEEVVHKCSRGDERYIFKWCLIPLKRFEIRMKAVLETEHVILEFDQESLISELDEEIKNANSQESIQVLPAFVNEGNNDYMSSFRKNLELAFQGDREVYISDFDTATCRFSEKACASLLSGQLKKGLARVFCKNRQVLLDRIIKESREYEDDLHNSLTSSFYTTSGQLFLNNREWFVGDC